VEGDRLLLCGALSDLPAMSNLLQGPLPDVSLSLVSNVGDSIEA
jgi:hypothetical protein